MEVPVLFHPYPLFSFSENLNLSVLFYNNFPFRANPFSSEWSCRISKGACSDCADFADKCESEQIPRPRHTIDKSICQDFLDYAACEENGGGGGAGGDRRPGCDGGRAGYGGMCYSIARLAKPRKQKGFRRFGPTKKCRIWGHPGVRTGPLRRRKQKSALL